MAKSTLTKNIIGATLSLALAAGVMTTAAFASPADSTDRANGSAIEKLDSIRDRFDIQSRIQDAMDTEQAKYHFRSDADSEGTGAKFQGKPNKDGFQMSENLDGDWSDRERPDFDNSERPQRPNFDGIDDQDTQIFDKGERPRNSDSDDLSDNDRRHQRSVNADRNSNDQRLDFNSEEKPPRSDTLQL